MTFFVAGCNFWSRGVTGTVDTALKSLNLVFSENKSLGTIGVPHALVRYHLWFSWVEFSSILVKNCKMYFFGYHGYHYGTQKYSCWKVWCLGFQTPCRTYDLVISVHFYNVLKFQAFNVFLEQKFTFSYVPWNWTK